MARLQPQDIGIGRLFESIPDAVVVADIVADRIVLWNSAAESLLGYLASEMVGLPIEEVIPPHYRKRFRESLSRYRATRHGRPIDASTPTRLPALHKSGQELLVELTLSPMESIEAEGQFLLAVIRDVTERRKAEEAQARLAAIVNSSDDAILSKTLDGIITSWNPAAYRMYGYTTDEVLGKSVSILFPPDRKAELPRILARIRDGERIEHFETVRVRKDGELIDVSITVSPIKDTSGHIIGASTIARDISERKRAEAMFRRMVEFAPDAMVASSGDGRIVLVNAQTEKLFGYRRDELLGQSIEVLLPERFREEHRLHRMRYQDVPRARPIGLGMELFARRKDGSEFPAEISLSPLETEEGPLVVTAIRDITERKKAEQALREAEVLRESEAYFRTMADTAPVLLWVADPDKHCTYFNKAWLDFTGRAIEAELGDGWTTGIHPEDRERVWTHYSASFDARENFELEYRLRRWDGAYRLVLDRGTPRYAADGTFLGYIGSAIDITERKQVQEQLVRRERQQRAVAQLGQLALARHDLQQLMDKAVTLVAQHLEVEFAKVLELVRDGSALRLRAGVGWDEGMVGQATVSASLDSQAGFTLQAHEPVIVRDLRSEARFRGPALLRDHGVVSGVSVIIYGGEQPFGVLGAHTAKLQTFTDDDVQFLQSVANVLGQSVARARVEEQWELVLNQEQVARAEAERAVRERDEFLSVAAHELKTPITSLRGFAQLLIRRLDKEGTLDPERVRQALQNIDTQGARLAKLVNHLLDVSRIEAGRLALEKEHVDLAALVRRVVQSTQEALTRHTITLQAPDQLVTEVDPLRLEQVLVNLLDNAVKYGREAGPIEVELAHLSPDLIRLSVRDYGTGIPADQREHLFERFYRAHTKSHASGLGLGLYISKQIVELHGGEIEVDFPSDGGTRFVVILPTALR